ncbi:uncharacterized protein YFR016C-like isoform X2 [Asparagus officinalis]|uniref:uncharacterized protein YFR016C-like isoform X2 n=1 Tax=Asparagus officinalis TaxID=4686 RepID=UPI00098DFBEA|nr:uncharacterized protein YFR016C-like isoform X2 [Asparagus officinalis]
MATQSDHGQVMKSKREEKVKVEASGVAGIVLIGGALVAAAVGAAFVAHRARGSNRGRGRKNDTVNEEEKMGLRSLLSMKGEDFSDDSLVGSQESNSEKSEIDEESEKGEEGSEATGDSSTESNAEAVWPAEVIDEQKEFLEVNHELNQISEMSENFENKVEEMNLREEEFSFHGSDQIQEVACDESEMAKETREVDKLDTDNVELIDDDVKVEEFSFWGDKTSTPEINTEQNLGELEAARVAEEDKTETREGQEGGKIEENIEIVETSEISIEQENTEQAQSTETNETEKGVEASKEIEVTFGSEGEDKSGMLQELLSSADGSENEDVPLATSEGYACGGFENPEMIVEATENLSEANINDDGGFVQESDVTLVREEEEENNSSISRQEEVQEELADSRNSREEFGEQSVYPEGVTAQEKMDCPISVTEMDHQTEVTNKSSGEISGNFEDLKVADNEVEISEDKEGEEEKVGDNKQQGSSEESVEKDERTTAGGKHAFLPSSDKNEVISYNDSLETKENMRMNSDTETEEGQNTCNKTEMECSSSETAYNSLQDKSNQDLEESDIAHVEEGKIVVEEEETGSCTEAISDNEMIEEEKGSASIENEMKLKFEVAKEAAGRDQREHEQEVAKKDLEIKSTGKEKTMDSVLLHGSSKVFLFVLALSLVLGLIASAHHDLLQGYKNHLPEICHQVYQLIFPSYDGAIGEL